MSAAGPERSGERRHPDPRGRVRLLPGLNRSNAARELLAGLTLVAISVPLNIGYAQIAGLPPSSGLYALIVPSLLFALLASTRQVVVAPDAAAAAMVGASLVGTGAAAGTDDLAVLAAAQAVLGGLLFLVCAKLKLGFVGRYLSRPVLVGFIAGLAAQVMLGQVAKMLGLKLEREGFFPQVGELVSSLEGTHLTSVLLSLGCLAVLLGGRRWRRRFPWALVVMVGTTVLTAALGLADHGVSVLGEVPSGLPSFAFPAVGWSAWVALFPAACALTAVTMAEGLLVSRSYALTHHHPVNLDRDLAAFGAANIGSGLSGGFTIGSSTSRTAAMDEAGARTQLPLVVLAVVSVLLLAFGTGLLALVPSPAIGATVAVAVLELLGIGTLADLARRSPDECTVAVVCLLGVLVLGPVAGLSVAFFLALLNLVRRSSSSPGVVLVDPRTDGHPTESGSDSGHGSTSTSGTGGSAGSDVVDGSVVLRIGGSIHFANADALDEQVRAVAAREDVTRILLDLSVTSDVDVTGAERLSACVAAVTRGGVRVELTRIGDPLSRRLTRLGLFDDLVRHPTNRAALAPDSLAPGPLTPDDETDPDR
ncbi:SulP family inorganic anion transporter [Nocardioides yefusunii]|uniref:SulP family inorganic anion transporter n=1 Tax=Nocardioides yefusunii TaxID=2500546 RepID=A0ABW1R157_9ACTN|nr:SulP family inorganic anion transporter [Nocardioides yefusunii]